MCFIHVVNCIKYCTDNIKMNISCDDRNNFLSQSEEFYIRNDYEINNKFLYEPICMEERKFAF